MVVFDDHTKNDPLQTSYKIKHAQNFSKAEKTLTFSNKIYGSKANFVVKAQ